MYDGMARAKPEFLKSRARLAAAAEAIREEIKLIDLELAGYRKGIPLNEKYFERRIVPILKSHIEGISSAELQKELESDGDTVNTVNLRTFLSRYGAKGRLIKIERYSPPKWRIATAIE